MALTQPNSPANQPSTPTTQPTTLQITGRVYNTRFHNPDNGYIVLSVQVPLAPAEANGLTGIEDSIVCVGYLQSIREDETYTFTGRWETHKSFGRQFKFDQAQLILPSGTAGAAKYLSQVTAGVGIAKAKKIVAQLGEDALEKIKANPEHLDTLDFLTSRQREEISTSLTKNSVEAELAGIIIRDGIGMGMVGKVMAKYSQDAVKVVKENPYVLADDVWGVGFKRADSIAQAVGVEPNSPHRVLAAVDYTLKEAGTDGHVYLKPNAIIARLIGRKGLIEASGVGIKDVAEANARLIRDHKCIREGDFVYPASLYRAEVGVAEAIRRLLRATEKSPEGLDEAIDNWERSN